MRGPLVPLSWGVEMVCMKTPLRLGVRATWGECPTSRVPLWLWGTSPRGRMRVVEVVATLSLAGGKTFEGQVSRARSSVPLV